MGGPVSGRYPGGMLFLEALGWSLPAFDLLAFYATWLHLNGG